MITANGDKESAEGLAQGAGNCSPWRSTLPRSACVCVGGGNEPQRSKRLWVFKDFATSASRGATPDSLGRTKRAGPLAGRGPSWNRCQGRGLAGCLGTVWGYMGSR